MPPTCGISDSPQIESAELPWGADGLSAVITDDFGIGDQLVLQGFFAGSPTTTTITFSQLLGAPIDVGDLDFSLNIDNDVVIGAGSGDDRVEVTLQQTEVSDSYTITNGELGAVVIGVE